MENKSELKTGDIVQLKSGGPSMTVGNIDTPTKDMCFCYWFLQEQLLKDNFPVKTLKLVSGLPQIQ